MKGRRLTPRLIRALRPYYPGLDLTHIRVIPGIPPEVRRRVAAGSPASVSVANLIFIEDKYLKNPNKQSLRILLHELRHCQQYAKFGKVMYRNYVVQVRKHGYWRSRIELDARRHECRVYEDLSRRKLVPHLLNELKRLYNSE